MTTGQRISEKRKELGLSQEALGEKLGVSRQSIYKWESDTSLPDIDKLIALSRLFGVSVGWLLGVEETIPSPTDETEHTPPPDWEERQEQLVEEVLRRYQAAQPAPKRSRWPIAALCVLGGLSVVLLWSVGSVSEKLDILYGRYNDLNGSVEQIKGETEVSLYRLTQRMEEILEAQNDLSSHSTCQISTFDPVAGTVTFSLSVSPKTFVEGMEVVFLAESDGVWTEAAGQLVGGQTFAGELTCPLTDEIKLSTIFITGDTRQRQPLEEFWDLAYSTLAYYTIFDTAKGTMWSENQDGTFRLNEQYAFFDVSDDLEQYKTDFGPIRVKSMEVGLFRNKELIQWLEPSRRPEHFSNPDGWGEYWDENLHDGFTYFYSPGVEAIELEPEDSFFFAARVTDEFGRVMMVPGVFRHVFRNNSILTLEISNRDAYLDPGDYQFEMR